MQVSYKKLWKLLIDKEMNKSDLQEKAGISWTSVTKMSKNKNVSMEVLNKEEKVAYMPLNGFTTVDIGCDRGNNAYNMVNRMESPFTEQYMQIFDNIWNDKEKLQDVTDIVIENISSAYNENSPEFIYFMTLYHVFSEFLDDISEDVLPNEATGFKQSKIWNMLYDFQKDAEAGDGYVIDHIEAERGGNRLWVAFRNESLSEKKAGFCGLTVKTDGGLKLERTVFQPNFADRIVDFESKY